MAKFERFRYIPMLVRAYHEARTRADSGGRRTVHSSVGDDIPVRTTDAHSRAIAPTQSQETGANHPLNHSRRNRQFGKQNTPAIRARKPGVRPRKPVKKAMALPKQNVQSRKAGISPVVKNLLRELRDTKQKLNQLTAIQSQLAQVQMKLDEQLQVLRQSVDGERQANQRETDEIASKM